MSLSQMLAEMSLDLSVPGFFEQLNDLSQDGAGLVGNRSPRSRLGHLPGCVDRGAVHDALAHAFTDSKSLDLCHEYFRVMR